MNHYYTICQFIQWERHVPEQISYVAHSPTLDLSSIRPGSFCTHKQPVHEEVPTEKGEHWRDSVYVHCWPRITEYTPLQMCCHPLPVPAALSISCSPRLKQTNHFTVVAKSSAQAYIYMRTPSKTVLNWQVACKGRAEWLKGQMGEGMVGGWCIAAALLQPLQHFATDLFGFP